MPRESEGHEHVEDDAESSLGSDEQEEGKWGELREEAELTDESALREYEESLTSQQGEGEEKKMPQRPMMSQSPCLRKRNGSNSWIQLSTNMRIH